MHPRMKSAVAIAVIGIWGVLWQAAPASRQPEWQVTDLDAGTSDAPDLAVDGGGNAIAVWVNEGRVRSATFATATGAWSPATTLSLVDVSAAPRVGSNAAGDAVAVWRRVGSDARAYIASSRYFASTKTWDSAVELPTNGQWPQAVIDGQGNATVVWAESLRPEYWYYYGDVHEIRAVHYDAATASWSSPVKLSGEYAWGHQIGVDGAGNVTVVWNRDGAIESVRLSSVTKEWSAITPISLAQASVPRILVVPGGDVFVVWSTDNLELYGARRSADTETWSPPAFVAATNDPIASLGVDAAGNVTVVYTAGTLSYGDATLRSRSYLASINSWSVISDIATNVVAGSAQVAVDPYGNATVIWLAPNGVVKIARRPVGDGWSTVTTAAGSSVPPRIACDFVGNIFVLSSRHAPPPALQAARWTTNLAPPVIAHVTSSSGALTIDFTPPRLVEPTYEILNYEYSVDSGATWTARTPASTLSPIVVEGLINGVAYPLRLRAIHITGAGLPTDSFSVTPGLAAPTNLQTTVVGNSVTFTWTPSPSGVPATGYMLEGGSSPGAVLARLPSPGTRTTFTAAAPIGVFYVRVRATLGQAESEPSTEKRINVGVAEPPSAPTNLLGLADESTMTVTWQNIFSGGGATGIALDVTGSATGSIRLPVTDRFTLPGVPPGTYTLVVRALNASGSSSPSNAVTLTFPGTCSPPAPPTNFSASKSDNTIFVSWSPPAAGAAPAGYVVFVTGSFERSLPTTGLTLSGAVGPGTYSLSVAATNVCGTSAATPTTTVTIP